MQTELTSATVPYLLHAVPSQAPPDHIRRDQPWLGRRRSVDRVRVLVIDADCARSARIAAQVHSVGSFETRTAAASACALDVADDFIPDIVLLNTDISELAPYRLAASLRHRAMLRRLRIIALTGDLSSADRQRAFAAGFEQYLTIPVRCSALRRVLGSWSRGGTDCKVWSEIRFLN